MIKRKGSKIFYKMKSTGVHYFSSLSLPIPLSSLKKKKRCQIGVIPAQLGGFDSKFAGIRCFGQADIIWAGLRSVQWFLFPH